MVSSALPYPKLDALPLGAHRLSLLTDEALFEACGTRVAFAGRKGGVSTGDCAHLNASPFIDDDPDAVARNHAILAEAIGVSGSGVEFVCPNQVHGTDVAVLNEASKLDSFKQQAEDGVDALVVGVPGVPVLMNAADCMLLALVAPSGRFALAHAGWRGAVEHIARTSALDLMRVDGCEASSINAYIGPHIRTECFEVGPEVMAQFRAEFGEGVLGEPQQVNLAEAVTLDLVAAGLQRDRICDSGVCTKCHPEEYFSYRATAGRCGRNATVAYRAAND